MKSTVVDESLSSYKPMYCSREYQTSTRLNQQYEKSTLNQSKDACIDAKAKQKKNKTKIIQNFIFQIRTHTGEHDTINMP